MGMAQVSSPTSKSEDGVRKDFIVATKTPQLWKLEHDTTNYYVRLKQSDGIKDPFAVLARADGETKASFFKLAGVRIASPPQGAA